jgi:hypothetical protein
MERPSRTSNTPFLEASTSLKQFNESSSVREAFGRPARKRHVSTADALTLLLTLFCAALAISSVETKSLATQLGQKNQLVVVGFLMSIMYFCVQRQIRLLLTTLEARFGTATLQDYNAILLSDGFGSSVTAWLRMSLWLQLALPLGLSVAYKQFVGGSTRVPVQGTTGMNYGPAGPVGFNSKPVGVGLGLFFNATTPAVHNVYQHPEEADKNGTFGFNLAKLSANSTAMLDGPLPAYLESIQSSLAIGESQELTARVNATFCSLNSSSPSERETVGYWNNIKTRLDNYIEIGLYDDSKLGLLTNLWDKSLIFISLFPVLPDEGTNETEAVGLNLYRGRCYGKWAVTRTTVTLEEAWDCANAPDLDQTLITRNWAGLDDFYPRAITEFLTRSTVLDHRRKVSADIWVKPAHVTSLFVTVAATVMWSRTTALNGDLYNNVVGEGSGYPTTRYITTDTIYSRVETMRRSRTFLLVLCLQPVLFACALLARMAMYSTPVGEGFGLVAMLAGVCTSSTELLRGAAFSGSLSRSVRVKINVSKDGQVTYTLGTHAQTKGGRLQKGVKYT